jgi:hypothetical protein
MVIGWWYERGACAYREWYAWRGCKGSGRDSGSSFTITDSSAIHDCDTF